MEVLRRKNIVQNAQLTWEQMGSNVKTLNRKVH